jgi:cytochrome c oxidase assembly protein subunit 15
MAARFAVFTALATLGLIALGGLVTSHGAGMAVPDWPTTYGYNMFLFPISQWAGGIFYEHTHRLYASAVGLLTLVLAVWVQLGSGSRPLARLGWLALVLVVVQGVLGGLRVNLMKDQIGVLHAALAQAFLALLTLIALFTSARWRAWSEHPPLVSRSDYRWVLWTTIAIFVQLAIGATMRHQHAGLAVPDFPLAYQRIWPPTDDAFLQSVNALRTDTRDFHPITAFQIYVHMAHRLMAVVVATMIVASALRARRAFGPGSGPARFGMVWVGLVAVQVLLGAVTVWSNKAADIATAHVVVGAVCLGLGAMGSAWCRVGAATRERLPTGGRAGAPVGAEGFRGSSGLPLGIKV